MDASLAALHSDLNLKSFKEHGLYVAMEELLSLFKSNFAMLQHLIEQESSLHDRQ